MPREASYTKNINFISMPRARASQMLLLKRTDVYLKQSHTRGLSPVHIKQNIDFESRKHRGLCSKSRFFLDWKSMFRFQWTGLSILRIKAAARHRYPFEHHHHLLLHRRRSPSVAMHDRCRIDTSDTLENRLAARVLCRQNLNRNRENIEVYRIKSRLKTQLRLTFYD